jgi:A/G-specific adenine glycosylase
MRAYAFNEPVVFVETNIRTVYIHHFFKDQARVPDTAIRTLIEKSLDRTHPRVFYWSLMDYGTYLKQTIGNAARSSTAYAKQPRFVGSPRQIRGRILRLLASDSRTEAALIAELHDARATTILADLTAEGLIQKANDYYRLP